MQIYAVHMQIPEKGQICEICSYKYRLTAFRGSKTDIYEVSYRYGNPVAICIFAYFQALVITHCYPLHGDTYPISNAVLQPRHLPDSLRNFDSFPKIK